jgi:hypothetical protein
MMKSAQDFRITHRYVAMIHSPQSGDVRSRCFLLPDELYEAACFGGDREDAAESVDCHLLPIEKTPHTPATEHKNKCRLFCAWADIRCHTPVDTKAQGTPKPGSLDFEAAQEILQGALPLKPCHVLISSFGLHAYWLVPVKIEAPTKVWPVGIPMYSDFDTEELTARLQHRIVKAFDDRGFSIDESAINTVTRPEYRVESEWHMYTLFPSIAHGCECIGW